MSEDHQGYQVVARRYRPQGFGELVGQNHVSQALSNAITTHRIGHAYLFTGARGVGKTTTARIFAKSLNCVHGPTPTPCNQCDACQLISVGQDVDVLEIDGASNRGIDEIRQLRQNTSIRPSRSSFKIYIIDEVHMLTREAFNALLKTLEEPPAHVKFIFCTTEANKIPITILSRCQRYDFAGIDSTSISEKLAQIAAAENVTAEEGVFDLLARRAAGSMRDAQSLLEQLLSFAPEHIKLSDVHEMLGTADDQRIFRLLQAMLQGETKPIFEELDQAAGEGVDYGILMEQLLGVFRDLMVVSGGADAKLLLFSAPSRFDELRELATAFGIQRILAALQVLDHSHNRMRFSTQERILLELALVRIAHLGEMQSLASLLEQIKTGQIALPQSQPQPAKTVPRILKPEQVILQTADDRRRTVEPLVRRQPSDIWRDAVRNLPTMISMNASDFHQVRFQTPDIFIVSFPVPTGTTVSLAKSFCEKEQAKIAVALEKVAGHPVSIRFELAEVEAKPQPVLPTNSMQDVRAKHKLVAELADYPMIRKACEMFGAELVDVKSTTK
ncbi:MAG: DNA polymerase III subunit gamma/tau [Planctomycetaceae bacterium]|nr:DNA polymerase III subunit gamma/tau [Planctomycetaceae bacterium]